MSDLLPNLGALLEQLAGESEVRRDARALAEAVAEVDTEQALDAALDSVMASWRQP
ncbi:hypothetical protein [Mycobacterium paraintracellulare]|uniref:hypothetical protein n=1 Tax=Mycobacterium paraintracellulare TaxID=1138383 RepID=UPI001915B9C1|nr:hypothetical protein [Mycobacterium paraintracellulare]